MNLETVLKVIKEKKVKAVRFEQMDMNGIARSKLVPTNNFIQKAVKGIDFSMPAYLGSNVREEAESTGKRCFEIGFGDAAMFPDFKTFTVLPWLKQTGRILLEPTFKNEYVASHPRVVARRQLDKLKDLGMSLLSAHEFEFYLVDRETLQPISDDFQPYSTIRDTPIIDLLDQFLDYLPQVGLSIDTVQNENGPGQLEITYKPAFGICAADNAHTFKTSIKEIALLNGYVASFMSKPYPDKPGSSCHFCHSLWDTEGKVPLLYDANHPLKLSEVGQQWVAGLLSHAPATEVFMAPTANCMERTKKFNLCPVNVTWGMDNRTCAFRVKNNSPDGTYIENRAGAAGCNPYLSLAATVAAGIDGVLNKLKLPPQVTGNAYLDADVPPATPSLPTDMEDALQRLTNDDVICDALGKDFIECFIAVKRYEAKRGREAKANGEKDWDFNLFFKYM